MDDRRTQIADAAIRVLGTQGLRQLTHRAVDAQAGLPAGSTSNYVRTRAALIGAVVNRLAELDRRDWERIASGPPPDRPDQLAELLAGFVVQATGAQRHRTLARYALFTEAAIGQPAVREQLAQGWTEVLSWASAWFRALGSTDPELHCRTTLEYLDGLILHELALPEPDIDPLPRINQLVSTLLAPRPRPGASRQSQDR